MFELPVDLKKMMFVVLSIDICIELNCSPGLVLAFEICDNHRTLIINTF